MTFEEAEKRKREEEEDTGKPDPLNQLVAAFGKLAMAESDAMTEDQLYIAYADIFAKSCGEEDEGGDEEGEDEEEDALAKIQVR